MIGTALATPFGPAGTLNMIIVARDWRGRGLARAMLERLMDGDARQWRLIATDDGLPLYEKLGFVETHRIVQQQGPVAAVAAPEGVAWAEPGDTDAIAALDRAATGMDRAGLVAALAALAASRSSATAAASRATRRCAASAAARWRPRRPRRRRRPAPARLSLRRPPRRLPPRRHPEASGLGDWLAAQGLAPVGGGIAMVRGGAPAAAPEFQTFALAAQALG